MAYLFIALTIALTVYGQLVLKWQVGLHPHLISPLTARGVATLLLNPWVISAFAAAFAASICWMGAISRLPLSRAWRLRQPLRRSRPAPRPSRGGSE